MVFFDTPDLALDKSGVVVRARRIQGRSGDSVIKLRPLDPEQVSKDVRRLSGFGVEVDAIPGGFVCSGRLKCDADSDATRQVLLGERPLRKLYTKEQRALYRAHAPEGIELDDLAVLGPIFVYATSLIAVSMILASGLSFLGLGVKPPFVAPRIDLRQTWHRKFHHDVRNRWLRSLICDVFQRSRPSK